MLIYALLIFGIILGLVFWHGFFKGSSLVPIPIAGIMVLISLDKLGISPFISFPLAFISDPNCLVILAIPRMFLESWELSRFNIKFVIMGYLSEAPVARYTFYKKSVQVEILNSKDKDGEKSISGCFYNYDSMGDEIYVKNKKDNSKIIIKLKKNGDKLEELESHLDDNIFFSEFCGLGKKVHYAFVDKKTASLLSDLLRQS